MLRYIHAAFLAFAVLLASSMQFACEGSGFLGCNNLMAFQYGSTIYDATLFNNRLLRVLDPISGFESKILIIDTENTMGERFRIEITDFRDGAFGDCISTDPYFANPGLNYCVPASIACNQYSAEFITASGGNYVSVGAVGQIVITSCDPTDQVISGTFSFRVEDIGTGDSFELVAGSFSVCYLI
jgi:hypothetical protein